MTGFELGRAARLLTAIAVTGGVWASLGVGTAAAAQETVCPSGCTSTTIQGAVAAAGPGDTIVVSPGTYQGPIADTTKTLTIVGAATPGQVIIDADPAAMTSPVPLGLGAFTNYPIVYVGGTGNGLTLENLTVDGLRDGNSIGGRFEGIAAYDANLTVNDVTILGMSDGPPDSANTGYGVFAVNDEAPLVTLSVTNSRVYDYQKSAITVDGNSDINAVITGNTLVGDGPAAIGDEGIDIDDLGWETTPPAGPTGIISANTVTGNVCTATACGSDLLGDGGGDDDVNNDSVGILLGNTGGLTVSGNSVSDNDIGVWSTTSTAATTTISNNTLTGNLYTDVLAGFGDSTVSGNTIGGGPESTPTLDGVLVAGYHADSASANATIVANAITGTDAAVEVAEGETTPAPAPSAMIANNAITGNTQGVKNETTASINAIDDWWGCNGGPGTLGCDSITGTGASDVSSSPFLVLDVSALPSSIAPGATTTLLASIRQNSAGASFTSGPFPSGVPVTFATTSGAVGAQQTLTNGTATTTLSGTGLGTATVTGTLDNQSTTATVTTANPVSTTSSAAPTTITVTVPAKVNPLIAFLSASKLSLLADNPGSELTLVCVDGCSATVNGTITLKEKHAKHKTLTLSAAQLTIAADGSSVYAVSLTASQRSSVKHALSAKLTLSVSATDDANGTTITGSKSFILTRT